MSQVGTPRFPLQDSSSKGAGVDAGAPSHLQIRNPQSKIENSQGGIAQLVERQLCKLEVRGSNPLASSPESFRGCRAVALYKGGARKRMPVPNAFGTGILVDSKD